MTQSRTINRKELTGDDMSYMKTLSWYLTEDTNPTKRVNEEGDTTGYYLREDL
jgi:hypothetical protein